MEARYTGNNLNEKSSQGLPIMVTDATERTSGRTGIKRAAILVGLCLSVLLLSRSACHKAGWTVKSAMDRTKGFIYQSTQDTCPQIEQLLPSKNKDLWEDVGKDYFDGSFKIKAIDWLAGAIRIPTESFDKMDPIGVDPRWEAFGPFHDYLLSEFPLVHTTLKLTKVNTYGLLYEWKGKDASLKPLLLAAHQDVVPVEPTTVDQWTHPPYSGFYDGELLWGRGSSDDKSGLIGILASVETLISKGFQPTRSVVLAFGFDEEASGVYGAQSLGSYMLKNFGPNSIAMIVDEGAGFSNQSGTIFAVPGVGEKGYLDVRLDISTPGGHSSIPPSHTSIGMLSKLLVEFEANPYPVILDRTTPVYETLQCLAEYSPELPEKSRELIKKSLHSDKALSALAKELSKDVAMKSLIATTQAIDLIEGGVKANALPEQAWAVVNHRIATQSSVREVQERDTALVSSLASTFNLSITAFGEDVSKSRGSAFGSLELSDAWGTALEPAPISPTNGAPYKLLSGTIKATYNSHRYFENEEEIRIAPGIMTGNTDTRAYWKLTEHIFRYNHHNGFEGKKLGGIHTVNENVVVDAYFEKIRFFTTLILNADETDTFD